MNIIYLALYINRSCWHDYCILVDWL